MDRSNALEHGPWLSRTLSIVLASRLVSTTLKHQMIVAALRRESTNCVSHLGSYLGRFQPDLNLGKVPTTRTCPVGFQNTLDRPRLETRLTHSQTPDDRRSPPPGVFKLRFASRLVPRSFPARFGLWIGPTRSSWCHTWLSRQLSIIHSREPRVLVSDTLSDTLASNPRDREATVKCAGVDGASWSRRRRRASPRLRSGRERAALRSRRRRRTRPAVAGARRRFGRPREYTGGVPTLPRCFLRERCGAGAQHSSLLRSERKLALGRERNEARVFGASMGLRNVGCSASVGPPGSCDTAPRSCRNTRQGPLKTPVLSTRSSMTCSVTSST